MLLFVALLSIAYSQEELYMQAGYTVEYFSQPLDHINGDPGLINIKVLIKQGSPDAPLFLYLGGQTNIEFFFNMNGWLPYTLGPQFNATVAFIEHRYYGDSVPLESGWAYLNTDQALLDFASITMQLKPSEITPVVAFGGSYGGMLSAYFRIKFSHLVDGAISSSSPVLQYLDEEGMGVLHTTTQVYYDVMPNCAFNINDAYNILDTFAQNEYTWPGLTALFSTCSDIIEPSQVIAIQNWATNALQQLAQLNYPYPSNFDGNIPGSPVEVSCSFAAFDNQAPRNMWRTLQALVDIVDLYYNSTGTTQCFSPWATSNAPDDQAWAYQTCTELLMPQGSYGVPNDMFNSNPFDFTSFNTSCYQSFSAYPNPFWYPLNYGFSVHYVENLRNLTNVVFTYGTEDPLMSGSVMESPNPSVVVMGISGAAHHEDLLQPSRDDSISVRAARRVELQNIRAWIS